MISALCFLLFLSVVIYWGYLFLRLIIVIALSAFADDPVEFVNRWGPKYDTPPAEPPDPHDLQPWLLLACIAFIKNAFVDDPAKFENHDGLNSVSPPTEPPDPWL